MAEEQAQVIINLQQQVGALNNQIVALQQQLQQAPPQQARPAGQKIKMFTNEEGKDDWLSFKRHFITISNLCGYNDQQKRYALAGAMDGNAALATRDIDVDAQVAGWPPTIDNVMALFEARFLPASASKLAQAHFDNARQGPNETILNYHSRMRSLYNQAWPQAADDLLLIRRFIFGLRKRELRMQAMRSGPATYAEALEVAQDEISVQQLVKGAELGAAALGGGAMEIGAMDSPKQPQGAGKGTCHFCGRNGHWRRECNLLKKAKEHLDKRGKGNQPNPNKKWRFGGKNNPNKQDLIAALTEILDDDGGQEGEAPPAQEEAAAAAQEGQDF